MKINLPYCNFNDCRHNCGNKCVARDKYADCPYTKALEQKLVLEESIVSVLKDARWDLVQ